MNDAASITVFEKRMATALQKAIDILGDGIQRVAADKLGITEQAMSQWVAKGRVPAGRCEDIEKATDYAVTRFDLRPDVYSISPELARRLSIEPIAQHGAGSSA